MNNLKAIRVLFKDEKYNYSTSVNAASSLEDLKDYFVGNFFDVGSFGEENMQECIGIEIN